MSLKLFRPGSVFDNIISDQARKRAALSFRKTLGVYNYKVKPAPYYKNPHSVELRLKERLRARDNELSTRKLNVLERNSIRPFGYFTTKGRFIRDTKRIPYFNIPDLTDFPLKPFVTWKTEKIAEEHVTGYSGMTRDLMMKIKDQMALSEEAGVRDLGKEIFETEEGKKIVEEYFTKLKKRTQLKIANF